MSSPMIVSDVSQQTADRLERGSKLRESGCREWIGTLTQKGYGRLWFWCGERVRPRNRAVLAHRLAVACKLGRVLDSHEHVCHHCDNPKCINTEHLYIGNHKTNAKDMIERGRSRGNQVNCVNGHSLSGANIYFNAGGYRSCRICRRAAKKRLRERKRLNA